jgi:hypothetical protein
MCDSHTIGNTGDIGDTDEFLIECTLNGDGELLLSYFKAVFCCKKISLKT